MLPEAVLCYMDTKGYAMTVQGLYNLANDALGQARTFPAEVTCGEITYIVNLSAIQSAVDMINNAFDGCRIFAGWVDEKFTCPNQCLPSTFSLPKSAVVIGNEGNSLQVYPNPFSNKVTFEFVPATDAHAELEIQNILGQKVITLMNRRVEKGVLNRVDYQPADQAPGIFIYRLILDDEIMTGRIVYNKK
jgi:hypothetical protein